MGPRRRQYESLDARWILNPSDHTIGLAVPTPHARSASENDIESLVSAGEECHDAPQTTISPTAQPEPEASPALAGNDAGPVVTIRERIVANNIVNSEFPSLSGGPQVQNQNAMPQAWNSSTLRQAAPPQQSTGPRPSQPAIQQREPSGPQQPTQPPQSQSQQPDAGFGYIGSLEGQFDGQRQATNASQSGAADDFPPLGGGMNGERQERQNSILQGPTFSAGVNGNAFGDGRVAGLGQATNGQGEGNNHTPFTEPTSEC